MTIEFSIPWRMYYAYYTQNGVTSVAYSKNRMHLIELLLTAYANGKRKNDGAVRGKKFNGAKALV